jgi:hypothetical protein
MVFALVAAGLIFLDNPRGHRHEQASIAEPPARLALPGPEIVRCQNPDTETSFVSGQPMPGRAISTSPVPVDENEKFLLPFNAVFAKNPEGEDIIRNRLWLLLDPLNGPLVKHLGMTADEVEKIKALVVGNLVAAAESAGVFREQGQAGFEAALDRALEARQPGFDIQLCRLLGDVRFGQYQAQREDYSRFNGIKFLDGNGKPLADESVEQIISVMRSERHAVAAAAAQVQAERAAPLSTEERFQARELIAGRVFDRVQNLLSPTQWAVFGELQAQQLGGADSKRVLDAAENPLPGQ